MRAIKDLCSQISYEMTRGKDTDCVTEVIYDSRKVTQGCLFICVSGANFDGHDFAAEVAQKGACGGKGGKASRRP